MAFDVAAGKGAVRPAMNVTPLVDVVLVLLIIFMVITPMLTKKMWMHVPPKDDSAEPPPPPPPDAQPPIVVSLTKDGRALINGSQVSDDELGTRVVRMVNARADKVVFFDAEKGVRFGQAVGLMDKLRGAGVPEVAVLADGLPTSAP